MTSQSDDKKKGQGFNNLILGNMKSRSGKETTAWISDLADDGEDLEDYMEPAGQVPAGSISNNALPAQFSHPSIAQMQVKWVDMLFDLFQQYEVDFNRAVQSNQLRVETERAIITGDLISRMQGNDHAHYSGRLHTRYWTLVIRGNLSHIEGYIIPSDQYIGFENNVAKYTKYFDFTPVWDGELKWGYEKGSISAGQLPQVAKRIFGQLIRVSKGEADETERFGFATNSHVANAAALSTGEFIAVSVKDSQKMQMPDYLKHGGVFEDEAPLQKAMTANIPVAQNPPLQAPSPPALPPAATSQNLPRQEAVSNQNQNQSQNQNQKRTGSRTTMKMAAASQQAQMQQNQVTPSQDISIAQACDLLARSIDNELEKLSKAGAKAFENHDFAQVEMLMKRTAKLKSMKEQMFSTINDWKRMLQKPD